jgi:hypothetical protein
MKKIQLTWMYNEKNSLVIRLPFLEDFLCLIKGQLLVEAILLFCNNLIEVQIHKLFLTDIKVLLNSNILHTL